MPYPDSDDVVKHLLEWEQPRLHNNCEDTHDVESNPPDRNKAAEEKHPSPQLEVYNPLQIHRIIV